jgi:hypothetical protein
MSLQHRTRNRMARAAAGALAVVIAIVMFLGSFL